MAIRKRGDYSDHIKASQWEVRPTSLSLVQKLVRLYHYAAGGSNTSVYCHGLFPRGAVWDDQCGGVAWWLPPTKSAAFNTYPEDCQGVLSLSRLVILPGVPKGAATYLLANSLKLIDRKRWPCLVTYADEYRDHQGGIYRLMGWEYLGKTEPQPVYVLGKRMVSRKAGPKTRTHQEMLDLGCVMVGKFAKHKYRSLTKRARLALAHVRG